jgi:GntR family transcriptional repressor for pyruvate dehydrogenase complex
MSRLHEQAIRILIGDIVAGKYKEGETLPKEDDLVARFGVSRGTVRECVQRLEERGLVTVRHGRGAIVRPDSDWGRFDPDVVAALLSGGGARALLGEYLECRRILEVEAAGLAAERASRRAVETLSRAFAEMQATAESARENVAAEDLYREADIGFHREVINAAGNPTLGQITEPIHRALTSSFGALARPEERFERGLPEHERILDAITAHDPDAARDAMRSHLLTVEGYLRAGGRRGRARRAG